MSPTGRNPRPIEIQNIPVRTELGKKIREAFQTEIPKQFIETGYSELELRILAGVLSPTGDT